MAMVDLPGRFQIVPGQPTLVLDVAHNPHSVGCAQRPIWTPWGTTRSPTQCLARWLIKIWGLCFGRLAPLVDRWYFTSFASPGRCQGRALQQKWNAVHMVAGGRKDVSSSVYPDPLLALQAAVEAADPG